MSEAYLKPQRNAVYSEIAIKPRFNETDMRGHISNTTVPVWLDEGRTTLLREELKSKTPVMVVNLNTNFRRELHWGAPATVLTAVDRIGTSSICFSQEIHQNGQCCIESLTTVVTVDLETRSAMPVPEEDRRLLAPYQIKP